MTKKSANDRCVRCLSQKELYEESTGCKLPVSRKITISNALISNLLATLRQEFSPPVVLYRGVLCSKNAVVGNPAVGVGWDAVAGWGGAGDKLPGDHSV